MEFTIESKAITANSFSLIVTHDGATICESDPLDVPPEVVDRDAMERIWKSLRELAVRVLGAESPKSDRTELITLLRAAYWKTVADIGATPKGWVCLVYMPGFLGGLTCDAEYSHKPIVHPWELETCGLSRMDGKGNACHGSRHDLWFPGDYM